MCDVSYHLTPSKSRLTGEALRRPASLPAVVTLGLWRQVALAPVVILYYVDALVFLVFAHRHESRAFLAVGNTEVLTLDVHNILANFTPHGTRVFNSLSAHIAELALRVCGLCPTVGHGILNDGRRHRGAGRDDILQAAVVHHEVAHLANASLSNETPEHVGAMVAVCRLMEGLLGEEVPVSMLVVLGREVDGHALNGGTGHIGAAQRRATAVAAAAGTRLVGHGRRASAEQPSQGRTESQRRSGLLWTAVTVGQSGAVRGGELVRVGAATISGGRGEARSTTATARTGGEETRSVAVVRAPLSICLPLRR